MTKRIFLEQAVTDLPKSTDFWIGANQLQVQNFVVWVWKWYKAVVDFNDWDNGQPNSNNRCAAMNINSASWNSQDCSISKAYLCQVPAVMNLCDSGWTYYNGSGFCYKLFNTNDTSYSAAEQLCVANNAHLVSIHSEGENNFIRQLSAQSVASTLASTGVWIGYSYPKGWSDGSQYNYTKWYSSNPNANYPVGVFIPDGTTDYASMPGYWIADSSYRKRYLCKKQPTTYPYII